MDRPASITVTELTRHIKSALENAFPPLWVEGEVSGYRRAASGHIYFTLKDAESQIQAVMFRREAGDLGFVPVDGMQVLVHGRISVYQARGQYQIILDDMEPRGKGALREAIEKLRARLAEEGLFDEDRKKPMPEVVETLGVVTSPAGAAIQDILRVLGDRGAGVNVLLAPALVQGSGAPASIMEAMELLAGTGEVDLVIIGRGGGSLEDLLPFSDESLVRAVAGFPLPVLSAVGHETDVALSDLAADLSAPTPTAAARMVTDLCEKVSGDISWLAERLRAAFRWKVDEAHRSLDLLAPRLIHPSYLMEQGRMRLDDLSFRLTAHMGQIVKGCRHRLSRAGEVLRTLDPQSILDRGFAVVMRTDGEVVRTAADVEMGQGLDVRLADGSLGVRVTRK